MKKVYILTNRRKKPSKMSTFKGASKGFFRMRNGSRLCDKRCIAFRKGICNVYGHPTAWTTQTHGHITHRYIENDFYMRMFLPYMSLKSFLNVAQSSRFLCGTLLNENWLDIYHDDAKQKLKNCDEKMEQIKLNEIKFKERVDSMVNDMRDCVYSTKRDISNLSDSQSRRDWLDYSARKPFNYTSIQGVLSRSVERNVRNMTNTAKLIELIGKEGENYLKNQILYEDLFRVSVEMFKNLRFLKKYGKKNITGNNLDLNHWPIRRIGMCSA